jgi:hypothetical protein
VPNSFGAATETEPLDINPFDTLLVGVILGKEGHDSLKGPKPP